MSEDGLGSYLVTCYPCAAEGESVLFTPLLLQGAGDLPPARPQEDHFESWFSVEVMGSGTTQLDFDSQPCHL